MIRGLLIDLDGTVTKYNIDYQSMRKDMVSKLVELNASMPEYDNMPIYAILISVKEKHDEEAYARIKQQIFPILGNYEEEAAKTVEPQEGVLSTVKQLNEMKIELGLVTNNSKPPTMSILKRFEIIEFFKCIVTRDESGELKPDQKGVLMCLKAMGMTPDETIYVGDAIIDVNVSKKVGMRSIIIPNGPSSLERTLSEADPDFIINNFGRIPDLLRRLNKE